MTETKNVTDLLRSLASRLVDHPRALEITSQQFSDGATYFAMKGHAADDSKLVGRNGAHVKAFAFLVDHMGRAAGSPFTFRLVTTQPPVPSPKVIYRNVLRYDPAPTAELLSAILETVDIGNFKVEVGQPSGPRQSLTFLFTITVEDAADLAKLKVEEPPTRESLGNAIGILFKAIGRRGGVNFEWLVKL